MFGTHLPIFVGWIAAHDLYTPPFLYIKPSCCLPKKGSFNRENCDKCEHFSCKIKGSYIYNIYKIFAVYPSNIQHIYIIYIYILMYVIDASNTQTYILQKRSFQCIF